MLKLTLDLGRTPERTSLTALVKPASWLSTLQSPNQRRCWRDDTLTYARSRSNIDLTITDTSAQVVTYVAGNASSHQPECHEHAGKTHHIHLQC
jgi:hypothetical protein